MSRVIAGMNWHELYTFVSKQVICDELNTDCTDGTDAMHVGG